MKVPIEHQAKKQTLFQLGCPIKENDKKCALCAVMLWEEASVQLLPFLLVSWKFVYARCLL